jgi:Na+/melibiose symporter-like transporter
MKIIFRAILKTIKWTLLVIVALAIISAAYNLTLPEHSEIVEHLSEKGMA